MTSLLSGGLSYQTVLVDEAKELSKFGAKPAAVLFQTQDLISSRKLTDITCEGMWNDMLHDFGESIQNSTMSLVLTFCSERLDWLHEACVGMHFNTLTLYSKCGQDNEAVDFIRTQKCASSATILKLPNVGRVDHAFAYHISQLPNSTHPEELILFVKDTFLKVHQRRSQISRFEEMLSLAAGPLSFGCGLKPTASRKPRSGVEILREQYLCLKHRVKGMFGTLEPFKDGLCQSQDGDISLWHKTSILTTFTMREYSRGNKGHNRSDAGFCSNLSFSEFLENLNVSIPTPLTPVCYGGSFASKAKNILKVKEPATKLLQLLSRGDNIIEGHYTERIWAGILSNRLPLEVQTKLLSLSRTTFPHTDMYGALFGCKS